MNKKTIAITAEQYKTIIATMKQGFSGCRPNERIATALILEANLGLRISDIVKLRLADIVHDGDRYRLSIVEQKTKKARTFTPCPLPVHPLLLPRPQYSSRSKDISNHRASCAEEATKRLLPLGVQRGYQHAQLPKVLRNRDLQ